MTTTNVVIYGWLAPKTWLEKKSQWLPGGAQTRDFQNILFNHSAIEFVKIIPKKRVYTRLKLTKVLYYTPFTKIGCSQKCAAQLIFSPPKCTGRTAYIKMLFKIYRPYNFTTHIPTSLPPHVSGYVVL